MKSVLPAKHILTITIVLSAMVLLGDVYVPPPHAMSYSEWTTAMRRYSALWRIGIPSSAAGAFIVALLFSVRRKRPLIMVRLAFCAPTAFLLPIVYQEALFDTCILSILGITAVSGLISVIHCLFERKVVRAVLLALATSGFSFAMLFIGASLWFMSIGVPVGGIVEVCPDESYEEYRKRAERIIFHHCKRCDKPMKEYGHYYWLCPDCDKKIMTCHSCGAKKDLVLKGRYWQEGYKWRCSNCNIGTPQ